MCWGKEFWFYCHSDHWYHYPAHSYYLWENGGQVVRMLAWNLKSWKNRSESWKSLGKSPWNLFLKKGMDPRVLGQGSLSVSLSLHSPSGIGYKLASSKTWWNAEEGGGGVTYGGQISCPGGWEGAILLVASCCRNWEKLWLLCELMLYV